MNTVDELERAFARQDWEVLHILLDDLNIKALKAIRDGHAEPEKLACKVLAVNARYQNAPRYSA